MENWQDATSQQVKLLTRRLNELLSNGLELLHSELGVDLGLKPELIPPWVILLAACIGLVLMVVFWASACRRLFKKRPTITTVDDGVEITPALAKTVVKSEEQKKKKKKSEKKAQTAQPNGSAVAEPQEEAIVSDEIVPHHQPPPPEVKAEKASEVKKSKKKAKQVAKETKTGDGKEPEDGTWETKVSNKEKREQRKKDKTSDGSASPGEGDSPTSAPPEPAKAAASPKPVAQKKKKANGSEATAPPATVAGGVTDVAVTVPSHAIGQDQDQQTTNKEPASLWGTEIDGSWTVIESGAKTSDVTLVSFSGLGVSAAEPKPVTELPRLSQPQVDDEWSGLNGGSVDPGSDWNAPSEAWVNYEEPAPPQPPAPQEELAPPQPSAPQEELAPPQPPAPQEELLPEPAKEEDEEEKDKAETKTKKKKKKKKKAAEEGGAAGQEVEVPEKEAEPEAPVKVQQVIQEAAPAVQEVKVERPLKDNVTQKAPATQLPQKATQLPQKAPVTQVPQKATQVPQKAPATQVPQKATQVPQKAPATQVPQKATQVPQKPADAEPTAKQNNLPDATQHKKAEESQAPKPAKKKKARRET